MLRMGMPHLTRLTCLPSMIALVGKIPLQTMEIITWHVFAGITSGIQYNLPGCLHTLNAGDHCRAAAEDGTCCPIGYACLPDLAQEAGVTTCAVTAVPTYVYAPSTCTTRIPNGAQCGEDLSTGDQHVIDACKSVGLTFKQGAPVD